MSFSLPDKWVWDFWFARHEGQHHIFYLQAPRALGDPGLRHHRATIGHAVSADLRDWRLLPDVVHPGRAVVGTIWPPGPAASSTTMVAGTCFTLASSGLSRGRSSGSV